MCGNGSHTEVRRRLVLSDERLISYKGRMQSRKTNNKSSVKRVAKKQYVLYSREQWIGLIVPIVVSCTQVSEVDNLYSVVCVHARSRDIPYILKFFCQQFEVSSLHSLVNSTFY